MSKSAPSSLVFIDTNIFLDFYRARGSRDKLSILKLIDEHHDRIITGDQVRMEFSKNRQRAILEGVQGIKREGALAVPSILADGRHTRAIERSQKQAARWAEELKKRLGRILREPAVSDPVYQTTHRLFENESELNLSRQNKERFTIRNFARKRFVLGYPPRKKDDTSIGDAINWEWLVDCAIRKKRNVVIVSRDGDYGIQHDGEAVINDWLAEEFKARVSKRRSVVLTDRLSEGFKRASVQVSKQAEAAEDELIKEVEHPGFKYVLPPDWLGKDPFPLVNTDFAAVLQGLSALNFASKGTTIPATNALKGLLAADDEDKK